MSATQLKIDLVSDVACPWCAVGLASLQQARQTLAGEIDIELHFQPFELNPDMPPEGEDRAEHIGRKYGISEAQRAENWRNIQARGAALGFTFSDAQGLRIHNTFDAHRLLHWAGLLGADQQLALKQALLKANFTDGSNVSDHAVLRAAAESAGLDGAEAQAILGSNRYADEVRRQEGFYQRAGVQSVPSFVINHRHLISGGQPPEVLVNALRQVAQQTRAQSGE